MSALPRLVTVLVASIGVLLAVQLAPAAGALPGDAVATLAADAPVLGDDGYPLTEDEALDEAMSHSPLRGVINAICAVGFVLVVIGLVLCIIRVLLGPGLADRVVASDLITMHITALVILVTIRIGRTEYFDLVLIVTLISFAATIAFAQLIAARAADAAAARQRQVEHDIAHAADPDRQPDPEREPEPDPTG
ncbi:MAG: monovalent cation/H+ antiporter complex subunit F [Planctomycetota bacterium]